MGEVIIWLLATVAGAVLYRMGGAEGYDTKWRDCGVSAVIILLTILLGVVSGLWVWLSLIPCFGLMWGALSTYRYFLPKPKDYTYPYYALHGFMIALAMFPFAWASSRWLGLAIRSIASGLLMGAWSYLILNVLQPKISWKHWDVCHECGRGAIIVATVPLMLI
jgi:hypothetical protein